MSVGQRGALVDDAKAPLVFPFGALVKPLLAALFLSAFAASLGCSGDCRVGDLTSCDPGLVCAPIASDASSGCFPPVEVRGRLVDLTTQKGLPLGFISALDETGLPAGELTSSGSDGAFTLQIPVVREDKSGAPRTTHLTLNAQAQDYQSFPGTLRTPEPIDTATATQAASGEPWVVTAPQTTVGLVPLPAAQRGWPHIAGALQFDVNQGAPLVVVGANGLGVANTLADNFGQFVLLNVPPGTYSLRVYSQGASYADATGLTVSVGSSVEGVLVAQTSEALATVSGNVALPAGRGPASVVLVPKSTVLPDLQRGVVPPGLSVQTDAAGAFSFSGVPDGDYDLLPAYENDGLVRDPSAADPLEVLITAGTPSPASPPPLAVVPAVQLVTPGATAIPETASATPTLTWVASPQAASYALTVFDAFGHAVFQATPPGSATSVTLTDPLPAGAFYQWRITALDGAGTPVGQSEALLGVFQVP